MEKESVVTYRKKYEEEWKERFSTRLKVLMKTRGITEALFMETVECDEARAREIIEGKDYPTVVEILRMCYLCYDADELFYGARDSGFSFLVRGRYCR